MSKNLLKSIKKITDNAESSQITVITNHLKIDGKIYIPEGKCEECHDDFITLEDAMVCRLSDYCTCKDDNCECNDYICFRYDWLNISIKDIVAYSIIQQ